MPPSFPRRRPDTIRLLSWNVAKRRDCSVQAAAMVVARPDIVVLQEVKASTWPGHCERLGRAGLAHAVCAGDLAPTGGNRTRNISSFVAIASRWPLTRATAARVPAPQAIACVKIHAPMGSFDLIGVHIPTSARADGLLMVDTQEGLLQRLTGLRSPTLLCGDFNSPWAEESDGTVIPFARGRGSRQRAAESALMGATNAAGMADLFRAKHGYARAAFSWYWKNRGKTGGYRLDHVFATQEFAVRACEYVDEWREAGLSDHSAIYADVARAVVPGVRPVRSGEAAERVHGCGPGAPEFDAPI